MSRTFETLVYLADNARRIVSREELLEVLWADTHVSDNTVDQVITKIRRALGDRPKMLKTVPRRGYRLMATVQVQAEAPPAVSLLPELFGRSSERAVIAGLLGAHVLVTLLGPGGVGKTTLARAALEAWDAPGRFVDLAPCRTVVDVVSAMASALGVPAQTGEEALGESLGRAIAGSGVGLFVLDNLEQVSDMAAPLVASWCAAAPDVRFLATSRHRLGLRGERVLEVEPLDAEAAAALLRARVEELDVAVGQDLSQAGAHRVPVKFGTDVAGQVVEVNGTSPVGGQRDHPLSRARRARGVRAGRGRRLGRGRPVRDGGRGRRHRVGGRRSARGAVAGGDRAGRPVAV